MSKRKTSAAALLASVAVFWASPLIGLAQTPQDTPAPPVLEQTSPPNSAPFPQSPSSKYQGVSVISSSYVLAPNDVIDISVLGQPEFARSVVVGLDGTINYIGAGKVIVAGRTVTDVEQTLAKGLLRQLRHPEVTVSVRESHPRQISVLGGVQTEGLINFQPGMRLLDAIATAGGLKQAPELTTTTLVTDHGTKTTPVDTIRLMVNHDMSLNAPLEPGDMVMLSPRNPEVSQVQVMGQVAHPGIYPVMPEGVTVLNVLNAAGGATPSAAMTKVQIMHGTQTRTINLRPLLFNIDAPVGATRIFAGDIVSVPLNANQVAIVGEVRNPQIYPIPDGQKWTVFRALTSSGGPTPDGDKKRISIVRPQPDGQYAMTTVNTEDLYRGKPGADDPVLHPGDILVVPKRHQAVNVFGALQSALGTLFSLSAVSRLAR